MAIDRRTFLAAAGALGLGASFSRTARALSPSGGRLVSAARRADGRFALLSVTEQGEIGFDVPLAARGHAVVLRPAASVAGRREAVVVARRPGRFAVVFDPDTGRVLHRLAAPDDRHFYGHGTFSEDGRRFFTTENDYEAGRGTLGIWDAAGGYRRIGEAPSHGIGPHDVDRIPGTTSLVAGNGGILTHPDSGRIKLNLPFMEPALSVVEPGSGDAVWSGRLPAEQHRLSIRHIAVTGDRRIFFGVQNEGPRDDLLPLVGAADPRGGLRLFDAPESVLRRLEGYCGDIAVDDTGAVVAASFPRGDTVGFWAADDGRFLGAVTTDDGCGVTPTGGPGGFWLSDGAGVIRRVACPGACGVESTRRMKGIAWDNHLMVV